jgi:hypothetical protein
MKLQNDRVSWIEQQPSKLWVAGSNPAGVAKSIKLKSFFFFLQYGCEAGRKLLPYGHSQKKI